MLVWIKDAPSISKHTVDKDTDFVNLYVTCKKMMKWQIWLIIKHTGMLIHAKKKDRAICRFGFPLPPLNKTMILHGLEKESNDYEKARTDLKTIESALKEMKLGTEIAMNFHEFMLSLNLSYNEYVLALRSDIKEGQAKVFLKRLHQK